MIEILDLIIDLIIKIDKFILRVCTKIAHSIQNLTGRTNFFIAKIGVMITSIATITETLNYFFPIFLEKKCDLFLICLFVIININLLAKAISLDEAEKNTASKNSFAKPQIMMRSNPPLRYLWLIFTIISFYGSFYFEHKNLDRIVVISYPLGFFVFYYFIAVEPLKPRKGLLKEFIEKYSFGFLKPVMERQ